MRIIFRAYPRHSIRLSYAAFAIVVWQLLKRNFKNSNIVELFEKKFADYIGVTYAVAVPSCRAGIYLGLKEMGFKEGDEVIMPAYNFKGMALAARLAGLKPVFIDIKDTDCNIDENRIEEKITQKTRVILISHMFGFPCDMDKIMSLSKKYSIKIIEDIAHGCGAEFNSKKLGSFGDFGVFSFGLGKNITCFGGGIIVTNNERLYREVKNLVTNLPKSIPSKFYGRLAASFAYYFFLTRPVFFFFTFPSILAFSIFDINYLDRKFNENISLKSLSNSFSNLTAFNNLQASIGIYQLESIERNNKIITDNASRYDKLLPDYIKLKAIQGKNDTHVNPIRFYYIIRIKNRDAFRKKLLRRGIDTKANDMDDCSRIGQINFGPELFPNTQKAIKENLEIPNNICLKESDINFIAKEIKSYLQQEREKISRIKPLIKKFGITIVNHKKFNEKK